jgi:predicted O-methyltransferase YrrM
MRIHDAQKMSKDEMFRFGLTQAVPGGLIMEFGTATGQSLDIIVDAVKSIGQKAYGFDSFEGLPERWMDGYEAGHFACAVPTRFLNQPHSDLVIGLFQDTLEPFLETHPGHASFIHIDCDIYSSTKYVLTTLNDRIVPGTVIQFDEIHNYSNWEDHEHKALMEFVSENKRKYKWIAQAIEQASIVIVV